MQNYKTQSKPTFVSKIRKALREMQSGQDAIFSYDREFRA
jgi:hypothetical protein